MVRLITSPIDTQEAAESVRTPESGGIDVFIGTTRNQSRGRAVLALDYEAYEPMALKVMALLEREACDRWPLQRVTIVHRLGRVEVGETSVVVAVSSAHRKEAFEACRFLIDRLKQDVPIWKREYFADGSIEWSGEHCEPLSLTRLEE
jgi:molybdopterin synthase catalytic subunit